MTLQRDSRDRQWLGAEAAAGEPVSHEGRGCHGFTWDHLGSPGTWAERPASSRQANGTVPLSQIPGLWLKLKEMPLASAGHRAGAAPSVGPSSLALNQAHSRYSRVAVRSMHAAPNYRQTQDSCD